MSVGPNGGHYFAVVIASGLPLVSLCLLECKLPEGRVLVCVVYWTVAVLLNE